LRPRPVSARESLQAGGELFVSASKGSGGLGGDTPLEGQRTGIDRFCEVFGTIMPNRR
jgi:hypothetical protein